MIAQMPSTGAPAVRGTEVLIAVSTGPGGITVPRRAGATAAAAQATLETAGLAFRSVPSVSASLPAGRVITQLPSPGSFAAPGTQVLCIVSTGTPR